MKFPKIPMAAIDRLSIYIRALEELQAQGTQVISSERLAKQCSVNPAQIRKDLAYFGEFGVRGVGYRIEDLIKEIKEILGLNRTWNIAMIGVGNLGSALIRHRNFIKHGYVFTAAFDIDRHKIGKVKRLHRHPDTNELESVEISDGLMHSKILSKSEIWGVGEKVILRMTKEEFKNIE